MKLEDRASALVAAVEQYREQRCAALLEPARAEARSLVRAALSAARGRVSKAIDEERKRLRQEVGTAQAALATEGRLVAQQRAVRHLGRGWALLRSALAARWADPAGRRSWTGAQLDRAVASLGHELEWQLRYDPAWLREERQEAENALRARGITAVFEPDAELAAGFVVTSGHNCLDASLDGLLADRAVLEGRLLQGLEELR